jgi:trehalose 6-phosphate phosphatase
MALAPEVATLLAPLRERPAESALFLDFDGTLAPIVERPEEARLLDGVTPLLEELAGRMGLVAFLSGRPIGQLQAMVGLDQLAYAGNHGMELRRRGEEAAVADEAAAQVPAIQRFVHAWPPERLAANGVWLEDKGPTLAFHYRGAADPESAKAFLDTQVRPVAEGVGLVALPARMVLEVRPHVALNKGTAAASLLEGTGLRIAAHIGDDRTDVHAWQALHALASAGVLEHAVGIGVDSPELADDVRQAADALVQGPAGAREALEFLAGHPAA